MTLEPLVLLALLGAGFLGGFVDAIAGGGGLVTVPALLIAGLPPVAALATNKVQSAVGTTIAVFTYARGGFVDFRALWPAMLAGFGGAFLGALSVRNIDTGILDIAAPIALLGVAAYFSLAPKLSDEDRHARLSLLLFAPVMGFGAGFYDGIFGPGTGSFMTVGFITLFGLGVTRAAGHTKAVNLMTNLGALALFIPAGDVVWQAAGVMAVAQVAGGYVGARVGMRFGAKLIKPLVVSVSVVLALRLLIFR